MTSLWLLLAVLPQASGFGIGIGIGPEEDTETYKLYQPVNYTCLDTSCSDRCGNPQIGDDGSCACVPQCKVLGNCCYDYDARCSVLAEDDEAVENPPISLQMSRSLECSPFTRVDTYAAYLWTVTSCPENVRELPDVANFVHKCENDSLNVANDLSTLSPVIIKGIIYKNIYCAVCHNKTKSEVELPAESKVLPTDFFCSNELRGQAEEILKREGFSPFLRFIASGCDVVYSDDVIELEKLYHACHPDDIGTCGMQHHNGTEDFQELKMKCSSYAARVADNHTDAMYRNPHCALCNGVTDFMCYKGREFGQRFTFPTFQLLLDVADLNNEPAVSIDGARLCPAGSVINNALTQTCTYLACPENIVLISGYCLPFNDSIKPLAVKSLHEVISVVTLWNIEYPQNLTDIEEILGNFLITELKYLGAGNASNKFYIGQDAPSSQSLENIKHWVSQTTIDFDKTVIQGYVVAVSVLDREYLFNGPFHSSDLDLVKDAVIKTKTRLMGALTFRYIYVLNFDVLSTSVICPNRNVLVEDSSTFQSPTETPSQSVIVSRRTNIGFNQYKLPIAGVASMADNGLINAGRIVFLCEHKIHVCQSSVVEKSKYATINDSLQVSGSDDVIMTGDFVILPEGNALVCNAALELKDNNDDLDLFVQGIMTLAGNALSVLCLGCTLTTYSMLTPLRTLPGKIIMNLCSALLIAQIVFHVAPFLNDHVVPCSVIGAFSHYFWLASFAWMSVLAVDTSRVFRASLSTVNTKRGLNIYCFAAWFLPLLPVLVCVGLQAFTSLPVSYHSEDKCWLGDSDALLFAFFIPVACFLSLNLTLFSLTVWSIRRVKAQGKKVQATTGEDIFVYIRLAVLMGFTWIFGFLANVPKLSFMAYPFIVLNTLQGVFIFLSFVCTRRVLALWKARLCGDIPEEVHTAGTRLSTVSDKEHSMKADR